jgi:hypothetical protein
MEGYAVAQVVEALCYKSEGRGFDFHWNNPSGRTLAPEMDLSSNNTEYQQHCMDGKGGRCVGLTTVQSSCANCL